MNQHDEAVNKILDSVRASETYPNFWSAYKRLQDMDLQPPEEQQKIVRIALLGSATLEPLAACIDVKTRLMGLHPMVSLGGFNIYRQEILDESSFLYEQPFDVVILAVDVWSLVDQDFLADFVRMEMDELDDYLSSLTGDLLSIVESLEERSTALILVNNFIVPVFSPFGIIDAKREIGLRGFVRQANNRLEEAFKDNNRVHIVNLESRVGDFGKSKAIDWNTYYRGAIPFSSDFTLLLADEYIRFIRALKGLAKKCIVLDLDNTLWGGVIGEDGIESIKLGNTSPGIEYVEFQRVILSLYNRGIILAINSKNNLEDALKPIKEHPHQVLREEHFAAMRINWQNKTQNMMELAQEINIGLDSMVFIDDNPHERGQMKLAIPEVLVVDMPKNPRLYRATIEKVNVFDTLELTEEDMKRGEMYVGKRRRSELESSSTSLESFLRTLELKVRVKNADDFDIPRVTQLINKTNQFNLTTRRYTDTEVRELCQSEDSVVYSMSVRDKFGDEGIVGVAVVRKAPDEWVIDSFLMSCRVIGRSVETAFLSKIAQDARTAGATLLIGEFIPTKKNPPAKDFYERHGFQKVSVTEQGTRWELNLESQELSTPEWIDLIEE